MKQIHDTHTMNRGGVSAGHVIIDIFKCHSNIFFFLKRKLPAPLLLCYAGLVAHTICVANFKMNMQTALMSLDGFQTT